MPDLALLKLDRRVDRPSILIAARTLELNEEITAIGFPGIGGQTITSVRGVYSGTDATDIHDILKTDAEISPGNSGGAAFDKTGHFIGVPTLIQIGDYGASSLGYLIPAEEAARFLQRYEDSQP